MYLCLKGRQILRQREKRAKRERKGVKMEERRKWKRRNIRRGREIEGR